MALVMHPKTLTYLISVLLGGIRSRIRKLIDLKSETHMVSSFGVGNLDLIRTPLVVLLGRLLWFSSSSIRDIDRELASLSKLYKKFKSEQNQ